MELLHTWDDSSTAKLLQEKFPLAEERMFRATIHALIFSEKGYISSNGSSNYTSLPPPPTHASSFALPTLAVTPPTPSVDIEYDQEVQVVSNEDSEALLDNEEVGDKEMGIALSDNNEGNGDEQIVNE